MVSVAIPFDWNPSATGDAITRIRNIYALVQEHSYTLKQAAEVAAGKAPKLIEQRDWSFEFRFACRHHSTYGAHPQEPWGTTQLGVRYQYCEYVQS